MPETAEIRLSASAIGQLGALTKSRAPDDPELIRVRQLVAALKAERTIKRALATLPAFTGDQVDELSALLRECVSHAA